MKTVLSVHILVSLFTILFTVQAEDAPRDDLKLPDLPEVRELRVPTAAEQKIFGVLKQAFPEELLDSDLKTLKNLSEHPDYLHYLTQVSGSQEPFQTFQAFSETALPSKSRYFQFCQALFEIKNVEEINTDDVAILYNLERGLHKHLIQKDYAAEETKENRSHPFMSALASSSFNRWMKKRGLLTEDNQPDVMKLLNLFIQATPNLLADAAWIEGLFERDGKSEGLLWLAIQDPLLFSRCLDSFRDAATFLLWVETDSHAMKKRTEEQPK